MTDTRATDTPAPFAQPTAPEIDSRAAWFWMVWSEGACAPAKVHHTEERAIDAAERLARKFPGRRFYLLKGYRRIKCKVARHG